MKTLAMALGVVLVALVAAAAYVWWPSAPAGVPFAEDGNVVRDNPGQRPGVWYLVYEKPGQPGLSVELDLSRTVIPSLVQGQRVHVEGTRSGGVVAVESITPVEETGLAIKLYYYNPALDQGVGGVQCSERGLVAVERVIPQTTTPLRDSIELLLRGELTAEERAQGIETEFPLAGLALQSASITDGVATLTFSDPQNKTVGGACRTGILWHQISATAKQFPTVREVRFMPEELFQP